MLFRPILAAAVALAAFSAAPVSAQDFSAFHVELDVGYLNQRADFVGMTDVVPFCPDGGAPETCTPTVRTVNMVRGAASIGLGGLNVEGTLARPVESDLEFLQLGIGLRLDTSYLSVFSVYFRVQYTVQQGDIEGTGGHVGLGATVWPWHYTGLYAEAAVDITSVPESMTQQGTLFSYARYFGGGIRFRFSPTSS
jgi:hypothetical protein